jgi:hypothetical protein
MSLRTADFSEDVKMLLFWSGSGHLEHLELSQSRWYWHHGYSAASFGHIWANFQLLILQPFLTELAYIQPTIWPSAIWPACARICTARTIHDAVAIWNVGALSHTTLHVRRMCCHRLVHDTELRNI